MPESAEPHYSQSEIEEALESLNVEDQRVVLGALKRQREAQESIEAQEKWKKSIWRFAAVYERAAADGSSDSNIEGWYEDLNERAELLLEDFTSRGEPSEPEARVRHTAALVYVYLTLERDNDEVNIELLSNAGEDPQQLLEEFQDGIVETHATTGGDREEMTAKIRETYSSLDDLAGISHPDYFTRIVKSSGKLMRESLMAEGYQLPELDENGEYGEEDEGYYANL